MRYEGNIYRPPSEAYSLLVQVTIGCAYNKCTFCSMFKDKQFRVRDVREVIEDLIEARSVYSHVEKIFLCDGDAMCLSTDKLMFILENIKALFPEVSRVGIYARAQDILRKSPEDLARLAAAGLGIAYIGAESGSDLVLERVNKGAGRADTPWCELLSCCEADFKSHRNNFRSYGENFARAMILLNDAW